MAVRPIHRVEGPAPDLSGTGHLRPTAVPTATNASSSRPAAARKRLDLQRRLRLRGNWRLLVLAALAGPLLVLCGVTGYYYVLFSRMIDARIHGEMQRVDPRVFGRPFELRRGQSTSQRELI